MADVWTVQDEASGGSGDARMVELPGMWVVCWESYRAPSEGSLGGAKLPQTVRLWGKAANSSLDAPPH